MFMHVRHPHSPVIRLGLRNPRKKVYMLRIYGFVYLVLSLVCLYICVCVCLQLQGPLRECRSIRPGASGLPDDDDCFYYYKK